jgi:flavin-dependent dehydrogenase
MTQKAGEVGARIYDGCQIKRVETEKDEIKVTFLRDGEESSMKSLYVIGADGVWSAVRRSIFPDLKVQYQQEIRECYGGSFPLDRNFFHAFYVPGKCWFDINHKGPYFCLEVSAKPAELKERLRQAKDILSREFSFDPHTRPLWRDACAEPRIHEQLIDKTFKPAKDRVLLIGDAAGFQLPTSDGIGAALLSGLMAGESVIDGIRKGRHAAKQYLERVSVIIKTIERQLIIAKDSRYKEMTWNFEEIARKIHSLMTKAMCEDKFSI